MAQALPTRSVVYEGPINNTTIWERFTLRPDDIFAVTPPKCGTTWTQIIVTSIIQGRSLSSDQMDEYSRWLDCGFRDRDQIAAFLEGLSVRRCIKSHSPLDGITYDPRCTYFAVYRHPIDVHFSMRRHNENMTLDVMNERYPDDIHEAFRMFLEDELYNGATDAMDLRSIVHHYQSFKKWEHLPNVHLLHYADMKANLDGQVRRIAEIMGYDRKDPLLDEVINGSTFASVKAKAIEDAKTNSSEFFPHPDRFFDSGTSNKWVGKLTDAEIAAFDERMKELLPEDQVAWLLWGSKGRP
jgi:aryl sulfotransferase